MTGPGETACGRTEPQDRFPLGSLLEGMVGPGDVPASLAGTGITGMSLDSRRIRPGNLFVAMPGTVGDGRDHITAALDAGATAVVFESDRASRLCRTLVDQGRAVGVLNLRERVGLMASRLYGDPSGRFSVIGITGTNGKTTCAWLLAQALESLGERSVMMGTIGSGFPDAMAASRLTTEDAVDIQGSLRGWLDKGATAVCMEVSSHGLDQGRVNGVRFNAAVFTNLSRDHLDYHGDMDAYAEAKKKLFRLPGLKAAVVNADDGLGRKILAMTDTPVLMSYGLANADVMPLEPRFGTAGTHFRWAWGQDRFDCRSRLIGEINLPNLLAVIATLLAQGYAADRIEALLPALRPPPGRMELIAGGGRSPAVVVDYAHTPDSLERALRSLRPLTTGSLGVVFGCGGDRDPGKRPLMGRAAARHADRIIITNDNPRGEDPLAIAGMARDGVTGEDAARPCLVELDRARAITTAINSARAGDVILIAGKGHETTQTIGSSVRHFSDREVAAKVLEAHR